MSDRPAFHLWLKQARAALDLGREELAGQVGCSLAMIRQLEQGRRRPSRELAANLARALGLAGEEGATFVRAARQPIPPARPPQPPPPLLPRPAQPLIGREAELRQAIEYLAGPPPLLLTLIGPGGVGKTHFALHLAGALQERFADGAIFVPLAGLHEPALLPAAIAQALQLAAINGAHSLDGLIGALRERELLLVLDNAEHLAPATPLLAALLGHCPRLRLLVTSQVALHLQREQLFALAPLPLPDPALLAVRPEEAIDLAAVAAYPAIELFVSRARMVQPGFGLSAGNARAVAEICAQLNGLPLAIELAAARVRGLPPPALLARLSDRLGLLSGGAADLPERHQALRSLIDWSHALLSEQEQRLFRRLAVFAGRWTLEIAEQVCADPDGGGPAVMDGVLALLDKSLLREAARPDGGAAFAMLHVIRDYALERLAASGEETRLRLGHARAYLALVRAAEGEITRDWQQHWLERLDWERDNIWSALSWLLQSGEAQAALELVGCLWKFWQMRSYWSEGLRWAEAALALPWPPSPAYRAARVAALWGAGWLAVEQRDIALAARLFAEGLALSRADGDQRGIARTLHGVGMLAEWRGEFDAAMADYHESLALFRALDDTEEIAWSLRHLSAALQARGRYAEARELSEEALALFRSIGHQRGIVYQTMMLAHIHIEQGAYQRAAGLLRESLAIARRLGYGHVTIEILRHLGRATQNQGRYAEARLSFAESLAIARTLRESTGIRWGAIHLAWLAALDGDMAQAEAALLELLPAIQQHEPPWATAWLWAKLGRVALEAGDTPLAAERYGRSLAIFRQHDLRWGLPECLEGLAAGEALPPGDAERCARLLGAAEALRERLGLIRPAPEAALFERALALLGSRLAPAALAAARQAGAALPLESALALASAPQAAAPSAR